MPNFVGRIHSVTYWPDDDKHTVSFAKQANQETGVLKGLASEHRIRAVFGDTQKDVIEKLRHQLAARICATFKAGADNLDAFTFKVALEEVVDGKFWPSFDNILGYDFESQ